ncbi:MAG: hypothetical protein JKY31_07695 [Rhodobacteraceae bacterium]|nr:hypothetical protein [Paracoccaceae bacterium]
MARFLSFLLFVAAIARVYFDWQASRWFGEFYFIPIGETWAQIHFGSLQMIQPFIERTLSPDLWENLILPVLLWPAAPTLLGVSVVLWLLGARKKKAERVTRVTQMETEETGPVRRMR